MKNLKRTIGFAALIFIGTAVSSQVSAQETKVDKAVDNTGAAIKKGTKAVEKTAKKVGNKTAEIAVEGSSAVIDRKYEDKVAPDGSPVYIDKQDKKYYVNSKGKKVYLEDSQLQEKVAD